MGTPNLPTMSSPPPPPDMADNILRQTDAQRKRKMQSYLGLSKYFAALNQGPGTNNPTPANMAPKTLLGR